MNALHRSITRIRPEWLAVAVRDFLNIERRQVSTPNGSFFVDPVSNLGGRLIASGRYEPDMEDVVLSTLKPGDTFIDLGANEGYFSVLASRAVGQRGRVFAVEPQDRMIPIIRRNLTLNAIDNVTIVHAAISDQPGTSTLHLSSGINTGSTSFLNRTRYKVATQQTQTMTLAEMMVEHGIARVALMKVDIEGYEYEAITGASEIFAAHRIGTVALEFHRRVLPDGTSPARRIVSVLTAAGYGTEDRANGMRTWRPDGDMKTAGELAAWLEQHGF